MKNMCWKFCIGGLFVLIAQNGLAKGETRAEIDAWLKQSVATLPAPGTVLTQKDLEANRALIAPDYFDYVNYPEVHLEIDATADIQPHGSYRAATAAHGADAKLIATGGMDGYVAGRPFDPEKFDDVSPSEAGMMVAWNHVHRWQYFGYKVDTLDMIYLQGGAAGKAGSLPPGLEGGGNVERKLVQVYQQHKPNHQHSH